MRMKHPYPVVHVAGGVLQAMLQRGIRVVVREGIKALTLGLLIAGLAGATRVDVLQRVYLSLF